jgi:hypothetical protein
MPTGIYQRKPEMFDSLRKPWTEEQKEKIRGIKKQT